MDTNNILIKNAHTHNLKNINLNIPKRQFTVFTGVSGSGKSSLLFDTIYTEAQRQLIETFSTFARARLPKLSRPDVEDISNLSTAIVIDQKRMGRNLRSTVGTATEINTYLRLLYSRFGTPGIGPSFLFSFNHPDGMCPACHGLGQTVSVNIDLLLDRSKSLREGAIVHPEFKQGGWLWRETLAFNLFDADKKLQDYSEEELNRLLFSEPIPVTKSHGAGVYSKFFEGFARRLTKRVTEKAEAEEVEEEKNVYKKYMLYSTCAACNGLRLNERALSVKLNGKSLGDLSQMELADLNIFLDTVRVPEAEPMLRKARFLADQLIAIGAGYLNLSRSVATLSGGESQRVKMARQLDCNLVDLMYILDEPSIGLHPRDTDQLISLLKRLRDKGNSVFVVEHDPDIIMAADWVVDIGPAAGKDGGELIYAGPLKGLKAAAGITAKCLNRKPVLKSSTKQPAEFLEINNASKNNLQNVSVKIPLGLLTCVTGVAGSGKSTLINQCFLAQFPDTISIDQNPIGRSSRGNIATYIGFFDAIRKEFAGATGADASLFSFNSNGACPKCKGQGSVALELHFLDAVRTVCDACNGSRFNDEALQYRHRGNTIADVLDMTVGQCIDYFSQPAISRKLKMLGEVGLGYLKIGQSLSSLSGGEAQRLKLACELHKQGNIYVMDEPTTGLHLSDIDKLHAIIKKLIGRGNTVIVIEHNLELIAAADWIIDMGPEGGKKGGEVLYQGNAAGLMTCNASFTGKYLKRFLDVSN